MKAFYTCQKGITVYPIGMSLEKNNPDCITQRVLDGDFEFTSLCKKCEFPKFRKEFKYRAEPELKRVGYCDFVYGVDL